MGQKEWRENDELFISELRKGYRWQQYVAKQLEANGLACEVPQLRIRKKPADAPSFLDDKDIVCNGKVLEVKSRRLNFRGPDTFPFETIFIDTLEGWKAKKEKPFAYVCVSSVSGAIIYTPGDHHAYWETVKRFDNVRKIEEKFIQCHRNWWRTFDELVKELKNPC